MPLALSWSELSAFEEDKDKWARGYLLGFRDPPSFQMERGTFIHSILFGGSRMGEDEKYTPDEIRTHDKILVNTSSLMSESWESEKKLEAESLGVPIKGYLDGVRPNLLLEVKTGQLWTKERAESHGQLFFYDLLLSLNDVPVEENILLSCSTSSGKCVIHQFPVDRDKVELMRHRISAAHKWMVAENLFDKRVGSKDRIMI